MALFKSQMAQITNTITPPRAQVPFINTLAMRQVMVNIPHQYFVDLIVLLEEINTLDLENSFISYPVLLGYQKVSPLLCGEIAIYAGFDIDDNNGNPQNVFYFASIDWHKLTYFIAFRLPFSQDKLNKYFEGRGNWYRRANGIRLEYWKHWKNTPNLDIIRRLSKNGEQCLLETNPDLINNNLAPEEKVYTRRGDYEVLYDLNDTSDNAFFTSALKNAPEYYFGNHSVPSSLDDSGIPAEYYLTAFLENSFATWKKYGSKPHIPTTASGLTIGFGFDLGKGNISNHHSDDKIPTNPTTLEPDITEYTINHFLFCVSKQWRDWSIVTINGVQYNDGTKNPAHMNSEVKQFYGFTSRGVNNVDYKEGQEIINPSVPSSLKDKLNLDYHPTTNPYGGWVNCLKATIPGYNRYFLKGNEGESIPLTERERHGGGLRSPKVLERLRINGLRTNPNVVELSVLCRMAIHRPGWFVRDSVHNRNFRNNMINAINQHRLDFLYKTIENANFPHSKKEILDFLKSSRIVDYYKNNHLG